MKFFGNLNLVLFTGLAVAILIAVFPDSGYRPPTGDLVNGVLQWLHVFFGITWIGLLYYLNFVQTPVMPTQTILRIPPFGDLMSLSRGR